ncbi:hypothetical protein [Echinicola sp. 20G]|uniref:hypothetical protein n=1 Tax=Echinicola sp. 20G TaxID=2781961 RepID=UPI0019100578|nr:hypothetical protein [Echinicola sp. 20G]
MSAHLLISSIVMLVMLFSQWRRSVRKISTFNKSSVWLIFLLIPLSFPGIAVISQYLFEGFGENILWYILLSPVLIAGNFYLFWKVKNTHSRPMLICYALILIIMIYWFIIGISQSAREHGPTPTLPENKTLLIYCISIHIALLSLLGIQYNRTKADHKLTPKMAMYLVSILYIVSLLFTFRLL